MFLTFGKYRGWHISETPLSYLAWLYETLDGKPELIEAARLEIIRRVSDYEREPLSMDRLKRVYRSLVIKHHPDKGGKNDIMTGINLLFEAINQ